MIELCQYGDLSDILKVCDDKKIVLSVHEQLSMGLDIIAGLQWMHGRRYVHMDLAARNCLMHIGGRVKIADFGLTRAYDKDKDTYRQVGVMKLSVRWVATDSLDHKMFSEKSDVWAFGITLWEIFTYGTQPYVGISLIDMMKQVRSGLRLAIPEFCPPPVFDLMRQCWYLCMCSIVTL